MRPLCGPKVSICCMLLSAWGIIQLAIMGIFYFIGAVGLIEDAEEMKKESKKTIKAAQMALESNYKAVAYNCWMASGIYFVFLLISASQFKCGQILNKQKENQGQPVDPKGPQAEAAPKKKSIFSRLRRPK